MRGVLGMCGLIRSGFHVEPGATLGRDGAVQYRLGLSRELMDLESVVGDALTAWSDDHVRRVTREFLTECSWSLEVDDTLVAVPQEVELVVYSRAIVLSDHGFGNHLEAVVFLGESGYPPNSCPIHGVLRLYLTPTGQMISEDRYSRTGWSERKG